MTVKQRTDSCQLALNKLDPTGSGVINWKAGSAWDILEVNAWAQYGEYKEPERSVTVDGTCFDAAAVNYVLYGFIAKWCSLHCASRGEDRYESDYVRGNVRLWKSWGYNNEDVDPETLAWIEAGYSADLRGNFRTPHESSIMPYDVSTEYDPDDPDQKRLLEAMKGGLNFKWAPYKGMATSKRRSGTQIQDDM